MFTHQNYLLLFSLFYLSKLLRDKLSNGRRMFFATLYPILAQLY